ncbi:MAG: acetyl-CoA acetyltransferase [Deltaproteobacteria bacterium]|nr:acetyl-CoA acetyltransferase [Deltaproteobacteria bacterium]
MNRKVGIVSMGYHGFSPVSPDLSFRELVYAAASKAYSKAGITPGDVDMFICAAEDFCEGYSISDEYCNDQLGAVLKPVHTVTGEYLQAIANAAMIIQSGLGRIVVVESHSKASNIKNMDAIHSFGMDPVFNRSLRVTPHFAAGLEMSRYLSETKTSEEHCARIVVKNRANALSNPSAGHGAILSASDVLASDPVAWPVSRLSIAPRSDGCIVTVLAEESVARSLASDPVWILGTGWATESSTLENRAWGEPVSVDIAAQMAYKEAGITVPSQQIDLFEIDDSYSFKELQTLEGLRVVGRGQAAHALDEGRLGPEGDIPTNVSGGSQGVGHLLEATGGQKLLELFLQLTYQAGERQLPDVQVGLAQAWRGVPTTTSAVIIVGNE